MLKPAAALSYAKVAARRAMGREAKSKLSKNWANLEQRSNDEIVMVEVDQPLRYEEAKPQFDIPDRIDDALWSRIEPALPRDAAKVTGGRPRSSDRQTMEGILFKFRTDCPWKKLPARFGRPSTIHDRYQAWKECGVMKAVFEPFRS